LKQSERDSDYLVNFLAAGSSAALLAIAHLYPKLWFISFVAFIPFLWQTIRISLAASIVTGVLFASSYYFVTVPLSSWLTPAAVFPQFLIVNLLFAAYGAAVNGLSRKIGFNAVFIAVLWLPLEYLLNNHLVGVSLFSGIQTDSLLLVRIGSLFGVLMVSFTIIMINSLILMLFGYVIPLLKSRQEYSVEWAEKLHFRYIEIAFARQRYFIPNRRAPPLL